MFVIFADINAMDAPRLYIISGCNGAGKTTASFTILPEIFGCRQFVNADEIAQGLSPLRPAGVAIDAGRIMLARIEKLIRSRQSFAIETTLATRSYRKLIDRAHAAGYVVELLYVWLCSVALACERVARRVAEGGHDIPVDVIARRYHQGIKNLFEIFIPAVDVWTIVDNSEGMLQFVAASEGIIDQSTYDKIREQQ